MITVVAPPIQVPFFRKLLSAKWTEAAYAVNEGSTVKLSTPELRIKGALLATIWVDRKVPYPELIPRDPDTYVKVLAVLDRMFRHPDAELRAIPEYIRHRRPFLLGKQLSVLDLWAVSHTQDRHYHALIDATLQHSRVSL